MKCPICGSTASERIYRLCDNMKILGASFPEKEANIVACADCGLVYMDTAATQEDFLSYYKYGAVSPKYYDMFGEEETRHYYKHILDIVRPYLKAGNKIYDIAGAWGELAKFFFDEGFRDITVIDPNADCIASSKEKGLQTAQCSSLDMTGFLQDKCDFILLNHTLEHILDVRKTFENFGVLLKDGGYLFIEVPNAHLYVNEESAPFNFLTYEHVLHLTENDLKNIAALYGYQVCKLGEYYKKVSSYPSVFVVFQKDGKTSGIIHSDLARKQVIAYIEKSREAIERFVAPLRTSGEPLTLWGIGASTAILLDSFTGCNVKALVDSNPKRQGIRFTIDGRQYEIKSPAIVEDETIVILSIPYHASIERQIRSSGMKNKIVALA